MVLKIWAFGPVAILLAAIVGREVPSATVPTQILPDPTFADRVDVFKSSYITEKILRF